MPVPTFVRSVVVPALLAAAGSAMLVWTGFLSFFFLVPFVYLVYRYSTKTACISAFAFLLFYTALGFASSSVSKTGIISAVYLGVLVLSFVWAVSDRGHARRRLNLSIRLCLSAVAASLMFFLVFRSFTADPQMMGVFEAQIKAYTDSIRESVSSDVVQSSLLEKNLDISRIMDEITLVLTRGGALVLHLLFLVFSWRFGLLLASVKRLDLRGAHSFVAFRNPLSLIWFFIGSLACVLAGKAGNIVAIEIPGTNLAVLCIILFSAQGYGIVLYNLARIQAPRFVVNLIFISILLAFLTLGLSGFVISGVFLTLAAVGVAENWLPLRAPISHEPPSTPGDGL